MNVPSLFRLNTAIFCAISFTIICLHIVLQYPLFIYPMSLMSDELRLMSNKGDNLPVQYF